MGSRSFDDFIRQLKDLSSTGDELVADALHCINRYFFQRDRVSGAYSPFEAFWREEHASVIKLEVDSKACAAVAEILHNLLISGNFIRPTDNVDVAGVPPQAIANVRFFTAVQDFKVDIHKKGKNPYKDSERTLFDAALILSQPQTVPFRILQYLGAEGSQIDKRISWMIAQAQFLAGEQRGEAYNIAESYGYDAARIKEMLTGEIGMGFKEKKADMFLRDMAEFGVWNFRAGFESINVASDANAMRVALRTGILRGRTPLLASMLDVCCHQYAYVDHKTQEAWRRVWEVWGEVHPNTQPMAPASIDYMIYKGIGKTFCLKTPKCKSKRGCCYFDCHCPPNLRQLQPPRSISLRGQTSWDSAATDEGGGLGLSS